MASQQLNLSDFGIGVEFEFLLTPRGAGLIGNDLCDFMAEVASLYKKYLAKNTPGSHPDMHSDIDTEYKGPRYAEWTINTDVTIDTPNEDTAPYKYYYPTSNYRS